MGADIHVYTEVLRKSYTDEHKKPVWVNADKWTINPYWYLNPEDRKTINEDGFEVGDEDYMRIEYEDRIYRGRNYALFGILAGVRWESPEQFEVKGFPKDASPEVTKEYEAWGPDGHTHSWLTLKELKEFDWNRLVDEVPDIDNVHEDVLMGHASSFWKDNEEDMARFKKMEEENRILRIVKENDKVIYAIAHHTYAELAGRFVTETIPRLESLKYGQITDEDIRIVFWFDN
jgi:hypothetical protein